MDFFVLRQEPGLYARVMAGWHFNNRVYSETSALLSSYDGYLRNQARLLRTIWTLLEVWSDTENHFLIDNVILGFLTIFKYCKAS